MAARRILENRENAKEPILMPFETLAWWATPSHQLAGFLATAVAAGTAL